MAVTIQMIETKEFKTKAHGYDPEEVDVFLDEIADEFEEMQREIQSLRAAAIRQQPSYAPAPAPAPAPAYAQPDITESAQKLLANTQRVCDETLADARKQAELIMSDARNKADRVLDDAKKEATRLKDSLDTMRTSANDYRARFRHLLDEQLQLLSNQADLFK